jgi:ParB-like chromosome segregation protein Spo0J
MADGGTSRGTPRRIPLTAITPGPNARPRPFDVSDIAPTLHIDDGCALCLEAPAVRPLETPGLYELIFGARRLEAARERGAGAISCKVYDVGSAEALVMHIIENASRADLPPLAQAEELARLRDEHHLGEAAIANRIGRPTRYVRQRLALLTLHPDARTALAEGRITLGVVYGQGKRPGLVALAQADQVTALGLMRLPAEGADPLGLAGAAWAVENELRRLDRAPFPIDDAALPGGACGACPKRTGAQLQLLDGVPEGDSCTDRACWSAKVDAHDKRRLPVVEDEDDGHDLGETEGLDEERDVKPEKVSLPKAKPKGSVAEDVRVEAEAEAIADERALEEIGKKAGRLKAIDEKALRLLCVLAIRSAYAVAVDMVLELRQIDSEKALVASLAGLYEADLRAILWMVLAGDDRRIDGEESALDTATRWAKIDRAALLAEALAEVRAKRPAPKADKPADVACTCGKLPGQKGRHKATCAISLAKVKGVPLSAPTEEVEKGEPSCPLTAEHIAALAADLEIKGFHPGACSPENVWSCAEKILAWLHEQPEAQVPRAKLLKAHESHGYDAADIAAQYLVDGGALTKSVAPKKGCTFRLVPGVEAVPPPK